MDEDLESLPPSAPFRVHMLAGALAGIVEHTAMYPLDSVKTRMQQLPGNSIIPLPSLRHVLFSKEGGLKGLRSLYSGIGSVVLGAGPSHALYFATYEKCKDLLISNGSANNDQQYAVRIGISGALATACSDAVMTPFDVIKQRMQIQPQKHSGIFSCLVSVLRREGIRALYVSYPTTLLLNVPYHSVHFPVYEAIRAHLKKIWSRKDDRVNQPMIHVIAGGLAGGLAAFCTTPIDVVKTVLQTAAASVDSIKISKSSPPRGIQDAVRLLFCDHKLYAISNVRVLFRGALPRTLSHMPSTALCWVVYEYFKHMMSFSP